MSDLGAHVTDGLIRLNRQGEIPGPGLVEAARELLERAPSNHKKEETCAHSEVSSEETIEEDPHMHLLTYKCVHCNKVLLARTVGCPTQEARDGAAATSPHCRKGG